MPKFVNWADCPMSVCSAIDYHSKSIIQTTVSTSKTMILEVAILNVKPGLADQFEVAFKTASTIIAAMPGYSDHQLQRCLETENRYLLLVRWQALEDHTLGFRRSPQYQEWRSLLHHFYDPFPTVEHYKLV